MERQLHVERDTIEAVGLFRPDEEQLSEITGARHEHVIDQLVGIYGPEDARTIVESFFHAVEAAHDIVRPYEPVTKIGLGMLPKRYNPSTVGSVRGIYMSRERGVRIGIHPHGLQGEVVWGLYSVVLHEMVHAFDAQQRVRDGKSHLQPKDFFNYSLGEGKALYAEHVAYGYSNYGRYTQYADHPYFRRVIGEYIKHLERGPNYAVQSDPERDVVDPYVIGSIIVNLVAGNMPIRDLVRVPHEVFLERAKSWIKS